MAEQRGQSDERGPTLTAAERYRLHAAFALDTSPSEVTRRLVEGRDPAVIEVVESILADRLTRPGKPSRGESPCCPGAGSMAHVRGCRNHPEADRG